MTELQQVQMRIEKEQEELLMKKYQGMVPKKPLLTLGGQKKKCFDSADWALAKEGRSEDLPNSLTALPPKLKPPSTPVLKRKASNLGRS